METTKLKETLPGPIKWPIFGSLFYLTEFKERVFMDWVKHYGNIYEVKMGSKNVVVVNGWVICVYQYIHIHCSMGCYVYTNLDNKKLLGL